MSDLIARIQSAQIQAGEAAVIANLKRSGLITEEPRYYTDDRGNEHKCRRRKDREREDPRIDHLFNGFDNLIASAQEAGDGYQAGYVKAMRQEFSQLVASLDR